MSRSVPTFTLLAAVAALTGTAEPARGQGAVDLKPYKMEANPLPNNWASQISDLRTGKLKTAGPNLQANRQLLRQVAQFFVYKCTLEQYYEIRDTGELRPRQPEQVFDSVLRDLEGWLLIPAFDDGTGRGGSSFTQDQGDYIREFGAAIDEAVSAVLAKDPPPVIRINAGRLLALAARSGAPAHYPTVQKLLTNNFPVRGKEAPTPPELLLYALKAAEGLLSAPDPVWQFITDPKVRFRHTVGDEQLVPFVKLLQELAVRGPAGVAEKAAPPVDAPPAAAAPPVDAPPAAAGKTELQAAVLTPEQTAVLRYFRREAVRALAQVRPDKLGGGKLEVVRPAFTLAQIAVSDASIPLAPSVPEMAEATLGLMGIAPTSDLNGGEWLTVIGQGMFRVVQGRNDPDPVKNMSVPWKVYSARVALALARLRQGTRTNPRLVPLAAQVNGLADIITNDVVGPLEKFDQTKVAASQPSQEGLLTWLNNRSATAGASRSLYTDDPKYVLNPRPAGQ
jgi:hypothetical protein